MYSGRSEGGNGRELGRIVRRRVQVSYLLLTIPGSSKVEMGATEGMQGSHFK